MSEFIVALYEVVYILFMAGFSAAGIIFGINGKPEKGTFYLLVAIWLKVIE